MISGGKMHMILLGCKMLVGGERRYSNIWEDRCVNGGGGWRWRLLGKSILLLQLVKRQ